MAHGEKHCIIVCFELATRKGNRSPGFAAWTHTPCCPSGVRPVAETWSEDCLQVMRRTMCNRFMCVEITGEREGMALVTMVDEGSDPQANVAEVLIATGCALPADLSTTSGTAAETAVESQASIAAVKELLE